MNEKRQKIFFRQLIIVVLFCLSNFSFSQNNFNSSKSDIENRPNILFILIDDLGYKDLGCYGTTLSETPNIDQLASEGMRFTQAYAYPVCSPTRASLISGQHPARINVWEVFGDNTPGVVDKPYAKMKSPPKALSIPEEIETYADILSQQGYICAHIGKWHAGRTPEEEGFMNLESKSIKDPELIEYANNNEEWRIGEFTAKSIEFLRANQDGPFLLNLNHKAVHVPIKAKEEFRKKYHQKILETGIRNVHPNYAAMTEMVDESVGMVLEELDKLGISENTVVIFYSDNGGLIKDLVLNEPLATSNLPLRGQKGGLYEGGIRVPLIVKWPGNIKPESQCSEKVMSFDLFATILELGGGVLPENQITDGISILPLLKQEKNSLDRKALYWHFPTSQWTRSPQGAIIKGDYKLVEDYETGSVELFNLTDDLGETINLVMARPEIARDLLHDLQKWREEIGAKLPTPNPNFDPIQENKMGKSIWK